MYMHIHTNQLSFNFFMQNLLDFCELCTMFVYTIHLKFVDSLIIYVLYSIKLQMHTKRVRLCLTHFK